ncbi:nucleotidyl transferase AbiEii/AbiGii toxin family protein [Deinococcus sp. YIM 134068]|uniref:nucleotidyl transferase AbiEii/AbiGii toxin family protein n=1 Tax=Deinococcus lichenicola TaxID=3118910 RepID=UPI002F93A4F3
MNWLTLEPGEQRDVLEAVAAQQNREPVILEKDLWVVWALAQTFVLGSSGVPMAFKGGTSLSKGYAAITRFSEDLDITLGLLGASGRTPADLAAMTRNQRDRAIEELGLQAQAFVQGQILPHLVEEAAALDGRVRVVTEGEPSALQLALHYPTVLPAGAGYIQRRVLLEFGGKNRIEPREQRTIRTYLAEDPEVRAAVELPEATVELLDARRTFWEKLTALQAACAQPQKLHRLTHFSRHLLDLHVLMQRETGPAALADSSLRDDVIATKTVLFRETGVDYADCRTGRAVIVPEGEVLRALEQDYREMEASGMFGVEIVPFPDILATLQQMQEQLGGEAKGDPGDKPDPA